MMERDGSASIPVGSYHVTAARALAAGDMVVASAPD